MNEEKRLPANPVRAVVQNEEDLMCGHCGCTGKGTGCGYSYWGHFPPTAAHLPPVAAHPPRARLPPIAAHFLKRNTNQGNRTSTTSTTHQQTLQFQAVPAVSPAQKPSSVIDLTEENSPQGAGTSTKIPQ